MSTKLLKDDVIVFHENHTSHPSPPYYVGVIDDVQTETVKVEVLLQCTVEPTGMGKGVGGVGGGEEKNNSRRSSSRNEVRIRSITVGGSTSTTANDTDQKKKNTIAELKIKEKKLQDQILLAETQRASSTPNDTSNNNTNIKNSNSNTSNDTINAVLATAKKQFDAAQAAVAKGEGWLALRKTANPSPAAVALVETSAALAGIEAPFSTLAEDRDLPQKLSAVSVEQMKARLVTLCEKTATTYAKEAKELTGYTGILFRWMQASARYWKLQRHARPPPAAGDQGGSVPASKEWEEQIKLAKEELKETQKRLRSIETASSSSGRTESSRSSRTVPRSAVDGVLAVPSSSVAQWRDSLAGTPVALPDEVLHLLYQYIAPPGSTPPSRRLSSAAGASSSSWKALPASSEVELLREELQASKAELKRVREERDALVGARRNKRGQWCQNKAGKEGEEEDEDDPLAATSRIQVERSVVEELEEQLDLAYGRIRELEAKVDNYGSPVLHHGRQSTVTFALDNEVVTPTSAVTLVTGANNPNAYEERIKWEEETQQKYEKEFHDQLVAVQRVYEQRQEGLQAKLSSAEKELEVQRKVTSDLENQLNAALTGQQEATLRAGQLEKEVETMWAQLDQAETRRETEQSVVNRRISHIEASMSLPNATKDPSPPATALRPTTMLSPTYTELSSRRESMSVSAMRAPSAKVSHTPVEQMSLIELRHEVNVLRQEVEQCQSTVLRLTTELENLKQKQKEERQRRQEARAARLAMLNRLQDTVQEGLIPMGEDGP